VHPRRSYNVSKEQLFYALRGDPKQMLNGAWLNNRRSPMAKPFAHLLRLLRPVKLKGSAPTALLGPCTRDLELSFDRRKFGMCIARVRNCTHIPF
jgi:hypothetical protein